MSSFCTCHCSFLYVYETGACPAPRCFCFMLRQPGQRRLPAFVPAQAPFPSGFVFRAKSMRGTQTLFSVPKHLITALLSYRDTGVLSGVGPCIYRRFVGWAVEIHGCRKARAGTCAPGPRIRTGFVFPRPKHRFPAQRILYRQKSRCFFAHLLFHVYCAYASVISL